MNPQVKLSMHCTNTDCNFYFEKESNEPDVICDRCGGHVEVNEVILIKEDNPK